MVGVTVSVYIPVDTHERILKVLSYPGTPFKSKSELIQYKLEETLDEYDQDDYKISEYEFGRRMREEDRTRKPYNVDIPFYERPFNGDGRVPPTYDDGIPNPEHYDDMEDMLSYMGSRLPDMKAKLQAKYGMTWGEIHVHMTGTPYIDPQYASAEHIAEEKAFLDKGPIGRPTQE